MAEKNEKKVQVTPGRVQQGSSENTYAPLVDIYETSDGTTMLVAELPAADPASVDIRVEKGVLTIAGQANLPELTGEYARTFVGFGGGSYFRAFALSDEIDREKIDASFNDGVLTLRLPRAEAAQTRKIQIKS